MNDVDCNGPLVSVVMPVFNSEKYVVAAIESVLTQTYINFELIVVDDCSKDNSSQLIKQCQRLDDRIYYFRLNTNQGVAKARNFAIKKARGDYIAFLDSDDLWLKEKLSVQIDYMLKNDSLFSFSAYFKVNEKGERLNIVDVPSIVTYSSLLKTCSIGCLTAVYNRKRLGRVYMPEETKREDFATWLSILRRTGYAHGVSEALGEYRVYPDQSSSNKSQMALQVWRLYRDIEKLSILSSTYYFVHYAVKGVFRTKLPGIARLLGFYR